MDDSLVYAESGCEFYVRIYIHVVEDSSYTMVLDFAEISDVVASLQEDFNPQGIYFVWDSLPMPLDYDTYYDTFGIIPTDGPHSDGIDIYLLNEHLDPQPLGGGLAPYIDGSSCVIWGNFPFWGLEPTPLTTSKVVSHEVGHIFGLLHTNNCAGTIFPHEDTTNCETAGDYVCDTPPDPYWMYDINPDSCGTYLADMTNIMAATHPNCMTHFTDGQGGRMRYYLGNMIGVLSNVLVHPITHYIDTDTLWNQNMHLNENVIITNNAKLTITSRIGIPEGLSIIVEPGSELIIDGGILTNTCGGLWEGIQVWGDTSLHQYPVGGDYLQGRLVLKNGAIVENAVNAMVAYNPADAIVTTGGIIQATNSTIRNAYRGADFLPYRNYNPLNYSESRPNRSYFKNCIFETTKVLPDSLVPYSFVTMWGVNGVGFTGCTFRNTRNDSTDVPQHYGKGIYSIDAGYSVIPGCDTISFGTCPSGHVDSCKFENLMVGVWATGANTNTYTYVVNKALFKNCQVGMISDGLAICS